LQISTDQQNSKEHTPPIVHITWSRVADDDDFMSGLHTNQTRMLRKEKKAQASPPLKEPKKMKQNQKKKKDAGVKLDKDGDEVEYRRYMYCATKSFSQFLNYFKLHPLFLR
jgi:hypothetical protein